MYAIRSYYGNPNSAYYFNGVDNYIVLPDNIITGNDSVFTFTFWYKEENDTALLFSEQSVYSSKPLIYANYMFIPQGSRGTYLAQVFGGRTLYTNSSNDSIYQVYPYDRMDMVTHKVWKPFVCRYRVSYNPPTFV